MHRFSFSHWAVQNFQELSDAYPHDDGYHRDPHKDTCSWFFNDPRAQTWRDGPESSIIWVCGSPGLGKSVLSRAVAFHNTDWWAQSYQDQTRTEVPTTTAYYDFRAFTPGRQSNVPVVCALLHQLFDKGPSPEIIDHTYVRRDAGFLGRRRFNPGSFQNMWMHFQKCARDLRTGRFVCVLDGLDECEAADREELLSALGTFISAMNERTPDEARSRIKFFLTSRPLQGDLEREFEHLRESAAMEMTWLVDANEMGPSIRADMEPAIQSALGIFRGAQKDAVSNILRENEQRTWLWLRVTVELIINFQTAARRSLSLRLHTEKFLLEFPMSVEGAYEKALDFASAEHSRAQVRNLMHIVLGARRPLSHREVLLALAAADRDPVAAMDDGGKYIYEEMCERRSEITQLLELLDGVIIEINNTSKELNAGNRTAQEYLMQQVKDVPSPPTSWEGSVSESALHDTLTRACISFILILKRESDAPSEETAYEREKRLEQEEQRMPFLWYAARNWAVHFNLQSDASTQAMLPAARALCTGDGPERNSWANIHDALEMPMDEITIVARLGIAPLLKLQLMGSHKAIHQATLGRAGEGGSCQLQIAIDSNDIKTVQNLFKSGMTLRPGCDCTRSSRKVLRSANGGISQVLLAHGADTEDKVTSLLRFPCRNGQEEAMKVLLDAGANVNIVEPEKENLLELATWGNHLGIVQVLLDYGIHFRIYGIGPLWDAAQNGYRGIVQVLLEKGLSPNIPPSPQQGSPLSIALKYGRLEIVHMLLEHGAKVTESDIGKAACRGDEVTALMLVDRYIPQILGISWFNGEY